MCLISHALADGTWTEPRWHFWEACLGGKCSRHSLLLPFLFPFLLPKPHGVLMAIVEPHWWQRPRRMKPESPMASRGCHVTLGKPPLHFGRRKKLTFNLPKLLLPNIPKHYPNAMPVQPTIWTRSLLRQAWGISLVYGKLMTQRN